MLRIIILMICLLALVQSVISGPIQSELSGYRCLVPDWSRSSGGYGGALSPDGKTLVYLAPHPDPASDHYILEQVWVIGGIESFDPATSEPRISDPISLQPWLLDVKLPDESTYDIRIQPSGWGKGGLLNVGWSPDGKRATFIFHGRLFVVEDFDTRAKAAKVRLVADVKSSEELGLKPSWSKREGVDKRLSHKAEIESPRWSPDGKKIAFLRALVGETNSVCVVDVDSGKETLLDQNVPHGDNLWQQPWSPDSKSLVYTSNYSWGPGAGYVELGGLSVVSVDGGEPMKIINDYNRYDPSWSPDGKKIAFRGPGKGPLDDFTYAILVCDADGKNVMQVSQYMSEEQKRAIYAEIQGKFRKLIEDQYKDQFTAAQLKRFAEEDLMVTEMQQVMGLAEAGAIAAEVSEDFKKKISEIKKSYAESGKFNQEAFNALLIKLQHEGDRKTCARIWKAQWEVESPDLGGDGSPVWSPDGRSIAFIRGMCLGGEMLVVVVDMATRKEREVFRSDTIEHVTWTPDGKSLLIQGSRNIAFKRNENPDDVIEVVKSMPSYSEIWLVDLKR